MKILVLVKAVRTDLVFDDISDRESFTINPYDLFALQHILDCKRTSDYVCCVSMGNNGAKKILEKCIALGADDAIWLNDSSFAGADTIATSYTLAYLLQKRGFDLIVCGEKAVDGETAQVPAGIAERLKLNHIAGVDIVNEINDEYLVLTRENEVYTEKIQVILPTVLSFKNFTTKMNTISMRNMRRAHNVDIPPVNASDLGVDTEHCGVKGSKTKVLHTDANGIVPSDNIYFENVEAFSEYVIKLLEAKK